MSERMAGEDWQVLCWLAARHADGTPATTMLLIAQSLGWGYDRTARVVSRLYIAGLVDQTVRRSGTTRLSADGWRRVGAGL